MAETDRNEVGRTLWSVDINNGQRIYVVKAGSAAEAPLNAINVWRSDDELTARQRNKGVYAVRARPARFGEAMQNIIHGLDHGLDPWQDNAIQFQRLIDECQAVLTQAQYETIAESMDLEMSELMELFERAQTEWDEIKANT